jgi:hypothetical protein
LPRLAKPYRQQTLAALIERLIERRLAGSFPAEATTR